MELTNITSSYSRKISNKLYGGGDFEMTDLFVSLAAELETGEDPFKAQQELHRMCRDMVNKGTEDEISSFTGGIPAEQFYDYLRDLVARRPINGDVYAACNERQKAILQAAKRGIQMMKRDTLKDSKQ